MINKRTIQYSADKLYFKRKKTGLVVENEKMVIKIKKKGVTIDAIPLKKVKRNYQIHFIDKIKNCFDYKKI